MADLLRLADDTGIVREFTPPEARLGRDPACDWCLESSGSISAVHARLLFRDGGWWLEDAGSRNGTFVDGRRLAPGETVALRPGASFRLAAAGPTFRSLPPAPAAPGAATLVEPAGQAAVEGPLEGATLLLGDAPPHAMRASAPDWGDVTTPPAPRVFALFESPDTQQHFALTTPVARIGRSPECEFRLAVTEATIVSRVHAELRVEGAAVRIADKGSSFGTFVNGGQLVAPRDLAPGDVIGLGSTGPRLLATEVNGVRAPAGARLEPMAAAGPEPTQLGAASPARGMTLFVRRLAEDAASASTKRLRVTLLVTTGVFAAALVALQVVTSARARRTESELAQQRREAERVRVESRQLRDAAATEVARLRVELQRAEQASAPRATMDSLQRSLESAMLRTGAVEASLSRAGSTLRSQLAATDSLRRRAEENLARLRGELVKAQTDPRGRAWFDSAQRAVDEAQRQLTMYDAQFRTLQSVTIAGTAESDQRAIGLVSAHDGARARRSSGFTITASGYFLSSRDALGLDAGAPDSVVVRLADRRWLASVVAVSRARALDIVLLKLRDFDGPHLRRVDWSGTRGAVNEPAAVVGFGTGEAQGGPARPGVTAAIVSRSGADRMRLELFGAAPDVGSPVFGANGEVIGVLQLAAPRETFGYAARIYRVVPLLPADLQAELGMRP